MKNLACLFFSVVLCLSSSGQESTDNCVKVKPASQEEIGNYRYIPPENINKAMDDPNAGFNSKPVDPVSSPLAEPDNSPELQGFIKSVTSLGVEVYLKITDGMIIYYAPSLH